MTMTKFHDLDFTQSSDGTVLLIQTDCGEEYSIAAHPEQIKFIAHQLCGMKPDTSHKVAELERRIAVLTDKLQNIVCNDALRSDLLEGIGEGFEYLAKLDGLLDLALEFDGGRLTPEYEEKKPAPVTASESAKKCESKNDQLDLGV